METTKIREFLRCHACNVDPGGVCPKCIKKFMSKEWIDLRKQLSPKRENKKNLSYSPTLNVDTNVQSKIPDMPSDMFALSPASRIELSRNVRRLQAENEILLSKLSKLSPESSKRYLSSKVKKNFENNVPQLELDEGVDNNNKCNDNNHTMIKTKPMHIYLYDNYMDDDADVSNNEMSEKGKQLRRRGLNFWRQIIQTERKKLDHISLSGNTTAQGKVSSINSNQSKIFMKNLVTPQFTYPTATLRASDIDYIDFEINGNGDSEDSNEKNNIFLHELLKEIQDLQSDNFEEIEENNDDCYEEVSINYNRSYENKFKDPNATDDMRKYWSQRFRYFSRFDDGIKTDTQGLFSVTPESIAKYIAKTCSCDTIVDGFCGIGGNAIKFAMTCKHVIAIDIDPMKIKYAKHNAAIYNVADKIDFIVGDFFELCSSINADAVYLAPPWGGPKYSTLKEGKIKYIMKDTSYSSTGKDLVESGLKISKNIAILLPKYANVNDLNIFPGIFHKLEYHYLNHKKKSSCMYGGSMFQ